jgi:hypothetical protein
VGAAAGGTQPFSVPNAGPSGYCRFVGHVFLTDDSATDAGTPSGAGPATIGDDPTVWLPALETTARQWLAAPTVYGDADIFDLRAIVAGELPEPLTDVHPVVGAVVCPGTVEQPTADRMAFAYGVEYGQLGDHPGYWDLRYAAFRRGSDGRWRYLAAPFALDGSLTGADCAPPIPHP